MASSAAIPSKPGLKRLAYVAVEPYTSNRTLRGDDLGVPSFLGGGADPGLGRETVLERFQAFVTEYGAIALVVHFTIYGVAIVGFSLGIQMGFGYVAAEMGLSIEESAGKAGTFAVWGSGWALAKAIQPLRIGLTFVLTPIVARFWHRGDGKGPGLGGENDTPSLRGDGDARRANGSDDGLARVEPLEPSLGGRISGEEVQSCP